jgi:antitoxin component of RelBE/YafQ-DinJ toxin-antitoxin module
MNTRIKLITKRWFYAVMVEEGITWSTAVRAKDEQAARSELASRYPFATVFNIER